jgi:outer membrane protein assembly factor BamD
MRFLLVLTLFLLSCSTPEKDPGTADGLFSIAQDFEKSERYDEAIRRYQEVKNKFPYSSYATRSEMAIADIHFKDEAYAESQLAYQSFRELHPRHAQIDYVTYRIGLSYFNQLPDSIDRDLSLAADAIVSFDELVRSFPQSQYVTDAKQKRAEIVTRLAEKEEYIGNFYFIRKKYLPAFYRYEHLLNRFPGQSFEAQAMYRAAVSAKNSNLNEKARYYVARLKEKYPNSSEYADARKAVQ